MRITVTPKGKTFEAVIRDADRALKSAHRLAGKEISRAGLKAIDKGAPTMWGSKLKTKSEVKPRHDGVAVEFFPARFNAGGWAMRESGTRPHDIYPRKRKRGALLFSGLYSAHVWHPGSSGERAWTRAGERLDPAVNKAVHDVYDKALTGG